MHLNHDRAGAELLIPASLFGAIGSSAPHHPLPPIQLLSINLTTLNDSILITDDAALAQPIPCTLTLATVPGQHPCHVHRYGASSRLFPKASLHVTFDKSHLTLARVFGVGGAVPVASLYLKASWLDASFARDVLTTELLRSGGVAAPLCTHAAVTINERFYGLFVVVEAVDQHMLSRIGMALPGVYVPLIEAHSHLANWRTVTVTACISTALPISHHL